MSEQTLTIITPYPSFNYLLSFRSQAAIVSEKSTVLTFPIEKPKLLNLTMP